MAGIEIKGGVSIQRWRPVSDIKAIELIQSRQAQFLPYDRIAEITTSTDDNVFGKLPEGMITILPEKEGYFQLQEELVTGRQTERHNDTKQAFLGRCVYWLCQSTTSEPVHHIRFEFAVASDSTVNTSYSTGNDGAENYWDIWTAVYTATASVTLNRVYLENNSDTQYAEYPNDGSPAIAQVLTSGDTYTVNWRRNFNGTPNASTDVGQYLASYLSSRFRTAEPTYIVETIYASYDSGVSWVSASATKTDGGTLSDTTVEWQATLAAHGEGSTQTIDHVAVGRSSLTPATTNMYAWAASESENWLDGEEKTITAELTVADSGTGDT